MIDLQKEMKKIYKNTDPVAIDAVDFIVRAVCEVCGVELMFALAAQETLLVVRPALGYLLLSFEDHAVASKFLKTLRKL